MLVNLRYTLVVPWVHPSNAIIAKIGTKEYIISFSNEAAFFARRWEMWCGGLFDLQPNFVAP